MSELSDRARAIAGAWFGLMKPDGFSKLTFHMQSSRPTAEAQAGLDELVAAGVIKREPFNQFGGVVYTPLVSCWDHLQWLSVQAEANNPNVKIRMVEPIGSEP